MIIYLPWYIDRSILDLITALGITLIIVFIGIVFIYLINRDL